MVAKLTVKIDGEDVGLQDALGKSTKEVNAFGHQFGLAMDLPSSKAELAIAAVKGVTKVTKEVASAAKDAAAEEKIFNDTMSAATNISGDYNAALDATIDASMRKAFTDTETRKALASLTTATGDAEEATGLLTAAQDIARMAGVDLETASDAVAKAYAGQDAALMRMLPGLEKGATATDTIKNATDLAAGAADSYAKSSQAMSAKVKIAFGELAEEVGTALGPALKDLGAALKPLLQAFGELAKVILPPLLKLMERSIGIMTRVAGAVTKIVEAITKLISKIRELLAPLTEAVNKLKEIDLNPFNGKAVQSAVSLAPTVGQTAAVGNKSSGGVTINIYGDPSVIEARVTKALRDYARRNGVGAVFTPNRN